MTRTISLVACLLVAGCGGDVDTDAGSGDASPMDGGVSDGGSVDAASADAGPPDASETDAAVPDAAPEGNCTDGSQNGDETGLDCGGACPACANGSGCIDGEDCLSGRCIDDACASPDGTHPDIVRVAEVAGREPGGRSWADSYSVDGRCYCETTFDHNIGDIMVETPVGTRTVRQVCDAIGAGPGSEDRPLYNDIQCGNGPANDAGDEDDCPGRVDIGREGCGHIGPLWDLTVVP